MKIRLCTIWSIILHPYRLKRRHFPKKKKQYSGFCHKLESFPPWNYTVGQLFNCWVHKPDHVEDCNDHLPSPTKNFISWVWFDKQTPYIKIRLHILILTFAVWKKFPSFAKGYGLINTFLINRPNDPPFNRLTGCADWPCSSASESEDLVSSAFVLTAGVWGVSTCVWTGIKTWKQQIVLCLTLSLLTTTQGALVDSADQD